MTKNPKKFMLPSIAQPNRLDMRAGGDYIPEKHNPRAPRRPGADQHERYGSRIGDRIYFRDGRVEDVQ